MAMMSGALYDALIEAGANPERARKAAEEVSDIRTEFVKLNGRFDTMEAKLESRFSQIIWMVGVNLTLSMASFGATFAVLWHLAAGR